MYPQHNILVNHELTIDLCGGCIFHDDGRPALNGDPFDKVSGDLLLSSVIKASGTWIAVSGKELNGLK